MKQDNSKPERDISILPRSPAEALEPARAPEPPRPKRQRKSISSLLMVFNSVLTIVVIGLVAVTAGLYFLKFQFEKPGPLKHPTVVVIPKGYGLYRIASHLENSGVISDRRLFTAGVIYHKAQKKLRAGEFEIKAGASMRQVLDQLIRGKTLLYSVTLPEGLTSQQIVERLNAVENLTGEITEIPPEGSLLPDTYAYSSNTDRNVILLRMKEAQQRYLAQMWPTRAPDLPLKTPYEAVILASIVEKETGVAAERAHIAGVFINRLRKGMRLQSDPTIIYGLVGGKGKLGRPIRRSELRKKTAYNTYHIDGLPPTPIANPGRAAIAAVLNPKPTKDLYFVADGTGGHVFAETLREHNNNVRKWRKIEKAMRARQAQQKAEREAAAKAAAQTAAAETEADAEQAEAANGAGKPSSTRPAATP